MGNDLNISVQVGFKKFAGVETAAPETKEFEATWNPDAKFDNLVQIGGKNAWVTDETRDFLKQKGLLQKAGDGPSDAYKVRPNNGGDQAVRLFQSNTFSVDTELGSN